MRKKRTLRPKPNVTRLNSLQVQQDLELASPNPDDVEVKWEKFRNIVCDTSVEHLGGGAFNCIYEDWFDENNAELRQLIETRNQNRTSMLSRNT